MILCVEPAKVVDSDCWGAVSMVGQEKALFAKNVGASFQKIA